MELNESAKLKQVREELITHAKNHNLYKNVIKTKGNIVFGRGDDESKILFIGEAPGFSENEIGKPFVGRSGKLLEEWVSELKIKNNEYAIINAVPIIPLGEEGKIRPPTQEEIDYFLPLTMKMIKTINPKVIVLLGKSAARIFGKDAMRVGETIDYFNIKMHFLYHPAYHLRNGRKGLEDLKNLKILLAQEEQTKKQTSLQSFS